MGAPNNRLHTDSALRASADGRSGFALFSSQHWFQADRRAERVKRDVSRNKYSDNVFFIVELVSRRVIHFNITAHPTDAWVALQLREATPYGQTPRFFIRDRDGKYGQTFKCVAAGSKIEILKTPYRAPKANAICERFLGSVRRECIDHILVLGESHLYRAIKEYVTFFNQARPHQGIGQNIPEGTPSEGKVEGKGKIIAFPVLNGLHHDYRCAARSAKVVGTNVDVVFG